MLRPAYVKSQLLLGLTRHLQLEAAVDEVSVALFPRPRISGTGLTLRLPNRSDLPPFISIARFSVDVGPLSLWRRHVNTVHADGLRIAVPPSGSRDDLATGAPPSSSSAVARVIVDHFVTHDAELSFVPRKPGKAPLMFTIHELMVNDVGFSRSMPFQARLTNPIPKGLVVARGQVGPWRSDEGSLTPLSGEYTFSEADLSTINGIGGTLASTGSFTGRLTDIAVTGQADVPNFSLDLGGKPVALSATFDTIVDGTDGTTTLRRVDAKMRNTPMVVTGAITNLDGPGRHDVTLSLDIANGRAEDLLALVVDSPQPVVTGDVSVTASLKLPPGQTRVRNRIALAGTFGLGRTSFNAGEVQAKLQELSRRSQGKGGDEFMDPVVANLKGTFDIARGRAALHNLVFQVPGATVALDGTYNLMNEQMAFRGTLRMRASVSRAVGGVKSVFIRPFDWVFRRDGAGAVIPIRITGTRQAPKFGIEMGRVFRRQ
jgi:hypothetical protein